MTHANAPLTPTGRLRLAKLIVDDGWSCARAAERFQVSASTAYKWSRRYRNGEPMDDRPSTPDRSPNRTPTRTEHRIIKLRHTRRWGPARIAYHLGLNPSTVHRVLRRYRAPKLACLDQATGLPVRREPPRSYVYDTPGQMVHMDIKKLGRIPTGGGWRKLGRGNDATKGHSGSVTPTCITSSTTARAWRTPRSSPTRRRTPSSHLGVEPGISTLATALPFPW